MSKITHGRARRAARADADAAARLIAVQERQIEAPRAEVAVLEAVVVGTAALEFDWVDPLTGEVTRRPLFEQKGN